MILNPNIFKAAQRMAKAIPPKPAEGKPLPTGAHRTPPKGYPDDPTQYAIPSEYKYPLDTPEHVRAALGYFSKPKNAGQYSPDQRRSIMARIRKAASKHKINVSEEAGPPGAEKEDVEKCEMKKGIVRAHTMRTKTKVAQVRQFVRRDKGGKGGGGGIGKTQSGKPIMGHDFPGYHEKVRTRGYNVPVSIVSGTSDSASRSRTAKLFQDYTAQDHLDAAAAHRAAGKKADRDWGTARLEAHRQTFGKDPEFDDYKISGIGRAEYSEKHKNELRDLSRRASYHADIARAHQAASKYLRKAPEERSSGIKTHVSQTLKRPVTIPESEQ